MSITAAGRSVGQVAPPDTSSGIPVITSFWRALSDPSRAAWARPLASLVVPGTGQLVAGRERAALYLIAEAFLLTKFFAYSAEGRRERDRYRGLALVVAREAFDPVRQDTVFEYFEQMGRFVESGPFDSDPGAELNPPVDERTLNGSIWALARRTFFTDPQNPPDPDSPEYQRALAFYTSRAIGPNFRWSWRNAGLEQDLYRQSIRDSDNAFRLATQQLGLILANHVLSAVDAFISERLSPASRRVEVQSYVDGRREWPGGIESGVTVRVAF